jgi:hypothetical protein
LDLIFLHSPTTTIGFDISPLSFYYHWIWYFSTLLQLPLDLIFLHSPSTTIGFDISSNPMVVEEEWRNIKSNGSRRRVEKYQIQW